MLHLGPLQSQQYKVIFTIVVHGEHASSELWMHTGSLIIDNQGFNQDFRISSINFNVTLGPIP